MIAEISESFNLGVFINADLIEYELRKSKFIDLKSIFGKLTLTQEDWTSFLSFYNKSDSRVEKFDAASLEIQEGLLIWKGPIDSYSASIIASFFRFELLKKQTTFSFETVMSHPSKVEFIAQAKTAGYKTYLYFICTEDPLINIQRVRNRKEMGGHDVPDFLIESRYFRSLQQLYPAFMIADRAFIIDSSNRTRNLILEKDQDRVTIHSETIPGWVEAYLISKLDLNTN